MSNLAFGDYAFVFLDRQGGDAVSAKYSLGGQYSYHPIPKSDEEALSFSKVAAADIKAKRGTRSLIEQRQITDHVRVLARSREYTAIQESEDGYRRGSTQWGKFVSRVVGEFKLD